MMYHVITYNVIVTYEISRFSGLGPGTRGWARGPAAGDKADRQHVYHRFAWYENIMKMAVRIVILGSLALATVGKYVV